MRLLIFLCLFSSCAFAGDWDRALHLSSGAWGDGFFLSSERTSESERREMERRLGEAQDPTDPDSHVACRFPWRARILGAKRAFHCPRLENWRRAFRAESVELLFASAFLNSPSSLYGHTLLKFKRPGQDLLHYTLSFGADTGTTGGLAYVWKGLTGSFPGFFSSAPFYLKVKEYNHVENRDFWTYSLHFTREETENLVDHAWELREARFDYYFLSRNCSWYLLDFLEAVRPELKLTERFPAWAIPADTIRVLEEAGVLGKSELRPSRAFFVEKRRDFLDSAERGLAEGWALGTNPSLAALPNDRKALVLDAAWELFRFREGRGLALPGGDGELLRQRNTVTEPTQTVAPEGIPPEKAHQTERLGIRAGREHNVPFLQIDYRGALHDLTDDPAGYEPHSELVMGDLRARWKKRKFAFERADVLRILSIAPRDSWMPRVAWNFMLGARAAKWREGAIEYPIDAGVGQAVSAGSLKAFLFLQTAARLGPAHRPRHFQMDFGPRGGLLWMPYSSLRLFADATHRWVWWGAPEGEQSLHSAAIWNLSRDLAIRGDSVLSRRFREWSLGVFRHF